MSCLPHPLQHCNDVKSRLFCLGISLIVISALFPPSAALGAEIQHNGESVQLVPTPNRNLMRIRIEMDVKGNVNVPNNPLVSRRSELTLPIKSDAVFDYEERYLRPAQADPRSEVPAVERYYHEASNSSRLNRSESEFELRESVRHVHVRRDALPETIYAVDDCFTGDELALLRTLLKQEDFAAGDLVCGEGEAADKL